MDKLEALMRKYECVGTKTRGNRVPDAGRDLEEKLVKTAPSDTRKSGPIFNLCQKMNLDFRFNRVQINKFKSHKECNAHYDKANIGDSRVVMLRDFAGGALRLEDGRVFERKWYQYDGCRVKRRVEPFEGERWSVVCYNISDPEALMAGSAFEGDLPPLSHLGLARREILATGTERIGDLGNEMIPVSSAEAGSSSSWQALV